MKKMQVLSLLLALTVLLGAVNIGIFMPAAAETTVYYPPNYDFTGLTKLSGNDGNQHATWTADGNGNGKIDATTKRTPSGSSVYLDDTTTNELTHIDMIGANQLPAGDYTLYAWVKTENVVKQNAAAGDQGARIGVVQWAADNASKDWSTEKYCRSVAGTNDWTLMSFDFTMAADKGAMRLILRFNNASGKVWFTDVTVQPKGTAYINPKADDIELKDVYYPPNYDFTGLTKLSGNDGNQHATWTADGNGNGKIDATTKRTPSGSSVHFDDTTTNESAHVDMLGDNMLPAGDYTMYAWVKTENVVKQNAAAGDQGARIGVVQWKADKSGPNWPDIYGLSIAGTNDWTLLSYDFTVSADLDAMRLYVKFNNASGKVWFTDVTVQPKGTAYIDPKADDIELKDVYYPPNYDFAGLTKLSGNDGNQHATWTADGNGNGKIDATTKRTPSGSSVYLDDTTTNELTHIDMIGANQLSAGDYTLYAWVKTENVVKQNAAAGDQGARLGVVQWAADNASKDWSTEKYCLSVAGTNDWTLMSFDFTVAADKGAMRLILRFNNASGKVWFTDVTVQPKGTAYIDPKAYELDDGTDDEQPVVDGDIHFTPNYDFSGGVKLGDNDGNKHPAWTLDYTSNWLDMGGSAEIISKVSRTESGYSVRLANAVNSGLSCIHVDMMDKYALDPGDYTLYAWAKLVDVQKAKPAAQDQGLRLGVAQWKAEGNIDWANTEKYSTGAVGTSDWKLLSFNFTVKEGMGPIRLLLRFNDASGYLYVTDVTVQPQGTAYVDPKAGAAAGSDEDDFKLEVKDEEDNIYDPGVDSTQGVDGEWRFPDGDLADTLEKGFLNNGTQKFFERWVNAYMLEETDYNAVVTDVVREGTNASLYLSSKVSLSNSLFVDFSGEDRLPAGTYKITVYIKTKDIVPEDITKMEQGVRLALVNFKKDGSGLQYEGAWDFRSNGVQGTQDWAPYSLTFRVDENVPAERFMVQLQSCTGEAWVSGFAIEPVDTTITGEPSLNGGAFEEGTTIQSSSDINDSLLYKWGSWISDNSVSVNDVYEIISGEFGQWGEYANALKIVTDDKVAQYSLRQVVQGLDSEVEYVFYGQVKTEALAGDGIALRVAYRDANGKVIWTDANEQNIISKVLTGDTDWSTLYVKFTPPAEATDLVAIVEVNNSKGTSYVTGLTVEPAIFFVDPDEDDTSGEDNGEDNTSDNTGNDNFGGNTGDDDNTGNEDGSGSVDTGDAGVSIVALLLMSAAGMMLAVCRKKRIG